MTHTTALRELPPNKHPPGAEFLTDPDPSGVHQRRCGFSVRLPRRAHNPLLIESGLLAKPVPIPWWGGAKLEVVFP